MIPYQHDAFFVEHLQEHRKRLLDEADLYRRMRVLGRKRGAFDATCAILGGWLVVWGTWLLNHFGTVSQIESASAALMRPRYRGGSPAQL